MGWNPFSRVGNPEKTLKALKKELLTFSPEELDELIRLVGEAKAKEEAGHYLLKKLEGFLTSIRGWLV